MSTYDEAIFKFMTEPNNFEAMLKVREHWDRVRRKLLVEFWTLVRDKLIELVQKDGREEEWIVQANLNYPDKYQAITLVKNTWEKLSPENWVPISVTWSDIFRQAIYGVWLDAKSQYWELNAIREKARIISVEVKMDYDHAWWPAFYAPPEANFAVERNLTQLLPENRDSHAQEYARILWEDIAKPYESLLDDLYQLKKQP